MDDDGGRVSMKRSTTAENGEGESNASKKRDIGESVHDRRQHIVRAQKKSSGHFGINFLDLSDEILLVILRNLDSPSLYNLSNTCDRFRNLVKEKKLWINFDFQSEKLPAIELLKRMHFLNQETRAFRIRGLTSNYPFNGWDNPTVTSNMLTMLMDSCPNLQVLSVVEGFVNFNKINIQNFPASLRRLELNKCEVPKPKMPQMFFHRIDSHMCHLEELCLEESYWFETHDLVLFSKMPELRVLNLNGSNSMTHCVPYASIASRYGFKKLEMLDLRNTPVSDSDIQCFNITTSLKELLLECPRNLRDGVRIVNQPSSSGTRKRRTSHQTRLRGKKRPASDTEGSSSRSDRPQESTENDDEDSSSDSCTRATTPRPAKCLRAGRSSTDVISITVRCDQSRPARNGIFPYRIDAAGVVEPIVAAEAAVVEPVAAQIGVQEQSQQQQQQQQSSANGEGPSTSSASSSSSATTSSSTSSPSSSSSSAVAAAAAATTSNPDPGDPQRPSSVNGPPDVLPANGALAAPPAPAPPSPPVAAVVAANEQMLPQVEIRQNGQSVRLNPIVIHNNNALGPIIIISGPPPAHNRAMRQMRIQVFKKKLKPQRKKRKGKAAGGSTNATTIGVGGGAAAAVGGGERGGGSGSSSSNNVRVGNTADDSVEGDDENEEEDGNLNDSDASDEDDSESDEDDDEEDDDDEAVEEEEGESYRPGFYMPTPMNLISDRGICAFGVSPNNVMPNWIWIRAEPKNPNSSIERLVVRNYRQVTDVSLQHLKQCTPKLRYLDVSGTSVTKEGVDQFRIEKPDCVIVADV